MVYLIGLITMLLAGILITLLNVKDSVVEIVKLLSKTQINEDLVETEDVIVANEVMEVIKDDAIVVKKKMNKLSPKQWEDMFDQLLEEKEKTLKSNITLFKKYKTSIDAFKKHSTNDQEERMNSLKAKCIDKRIDDTKKSHRVWGKK
jgi:xanthosine utilization system XapX-like protein